MNTYPSLPALASDVPKTVKDSFGALEAWLKQVQSQGGFVTKQKMIDSGYPIAADPQYHATGGVTVLPPTDGVLGITVIEELYATRVPGEYLSRLIVSWLGNGSSLYQAELVQAGTVLQTITTEYTGCRFEGVVTGSYQVRVRKAEIRIIQAAGSWSFALVTVGGEALPPTPPSGFQVYIPDSSPTVRFTWLPSSAADLAGYRIAYGDIDNTILTLGLVTSCSWSPYSPISGSFWIVAVDHGGRESSAVQSQEATVAGPVFSPAGVAAEVLDNTVLLRWQPATPGTYPIDHYEVRRSDPATVPFAQAEVVGRVAGTFSAVYEQQAGGRKYWVYAVDAAGLASAEYGVYASVSENDFFQLYDQQRSTFGGTLTNAARGNDGTLSLPVDTAVTYSDAFGSNTWSEAADLDTGEKWYSQPGTATGVYEEIVTYLPDSSEEPLLFAIIMDATRVTSGDVTLTPNIQVRALSTDVSWTDLGDVYQAQPSTGYRQVKYTLTATGNSGGVCKVSALSFRLQTKKLTRSGSVTVPADAGTVTVWLTSNGLESGAHLFKALTTIQLTPRGSSLLMATWDVGATPGPDHFHIHLFTSSGGAPTVDCQVDWTVTGV